MKTIVSGQRGYYLFGRAAYPPGGRYGPRLQRVFQLVALTRGSLRVEVDDRAHHLSPGQAILLRPGHREQFRFSASASSMHTWCEVVPRHLSAEQRRMLTRVEGPRTPSASIHLLIQEGLALGLLEAGPMSEAMALLAKTCLMRFAAECLSGDSASASPPPHPALARAIAIASRDSAILSSASELAKRAGISASHLRLLFRQHQGESPTDLIWRLKVRNAIQLLRSTGLTLAEIAEQCGFASAFHLSRLVKRSTGQSPRGLRRGEWGGRE